MIIGSGITIGSGVQIVPDGIPYPSPLLHLDASAYSGSGSTWTANTGSNATLYNTPTYTSASPTYFNFAPASKEYATVSDLGSLSTWSVECWVRVKSSLSGVVSSVVTNQYNGASSLNFSIGTNRAPTSYNLCVGFFNGAWRNTNGFAPTLNTWYHIVGTYDGSTIKQYVNNSLDTQLSYTGTPTSGGQVRIAGRWDDLVLTTDFFPGDIGVVRIWNSALTSSNVSALYSENSSRFV